MRLITYLSENGPRAAACHEDWLVDLHRADPRIPHHMKQLLAALPAAHEMVAQAVASGDRLPLDSVQLLAPVPDPEKILCIGLNYADHAAESGAEIPAEPVVFCKLPTALTGPEVTILLPHVSRKVDYEAELVVVIGRGGRAIPAEQAWDHVAGYTCGHDVSARDWQLQKPGGQWLLGKSFDTFAPCGPYLATRDEIPDPSDLEIRLRLNGQTMQDSHTRQLIFPVDQLIAYVSQVCTLKTGDLLYTGTPPGVGGARKPPVYLKDGDVVEVEISGLGILRNSVRRDPGTLPSL